jgi:hypothetical protein
MGRSEQTRCGVPATRDPEIGRSGFDCFALPLSGRSMATVFLVTVATRNGNAFLFMDATTDSGHGNLLPLSQVWGVIL